MTRQRKRLGAAALMVAIALLVSGVMLRHDAAFPSDATEAMPIGTVTMHAAATNPLDWHYMRGKPYIMRWSSGIGRPAEVRLGRISPALLQPLA